MKKRFLLMVIFAITATMFVNAQYGSGPIGGATSNITIYDGDGLPTFPSGGIYKFTNTYWDVDRCIYSALLPGNFEDWSLEGISYVSIDDISQPINNTNVVVKFYITYSEWVDLGKPGRLTFYIYNKRTGLFQSEEMLIDEYSNGMEVTGPLD